MKEVAVGIESATSPNALNGEKSNAPDVESKGNTNVQQHVTVIEKSPSRFCLMHTFVVVGLLGASFAGTAMLLKIMAMIQRGETPSGIKEINDSPPNLNQPLPKPCMAPRTKAISKWQCVTVHAVTLSSPSTALSFTENAPQGAHVTRISVTDSDKQLYNEPSVSKVLQDVHISARLMEDFLELAKDNTDKDLETCGVLGAFLENGTFYVTTLIIPKQDSTSSSCQAINEEEVFAIQNEQSLFPVGWIHTHPSQSCFMSSVDLHTHYSYQVMVPEAFAIVLAPTDSSRSYGIFRLTDPAGLSVLKECDETGFHAHKEPADGSPIYEHCTNVYKNSNLRWFQ